MIFSIKFLFFTSLFLTLHVAIVVASASAGAGAGAPTTEEIENNEEKEDIIEETSNKTPIRLAKNVTFSIESTNTDSKVNLINFTTSITESTDPAPINATETNQTQTNRYVNCLPMAGGSEVQLVNDTELIKLLMTHQNITSKETEALCVMVLFYSKYCPFSSMAAPHYNALPRAFPDIKMVAINAMMYHLFNTQNGIVGVPTVILFHNGRSVAKYNDSEYSLELFSRFITKNTGITAVEKSHVTSADFSGPVLSVPSKDSDIFLVMSWLFITLCGSYYFTKSRCWSWIVETVQSNWRDSAQHEHAE